MDIQRILSRYFYIAVDCDPSGECVIPETKLREADHTYADAKSAISNATWKAARLYRINFALSTVEDVSVNTAIALYHECEAAGEAIDDSTYADFIRDHIPANFDVGYRGPDREDPSSNVFCAYPEAAE